MSRPLIEQLRFSRHWVSRQYVVSGGAVGFGAVVSELEELLVHASQVIGGALVAF